MRKFEQMKRLYTGMVDRYSVLKYDDITVVAVTSSFDQLFELCWKTLKEYLYEYAGIREAKTGSPKLVLQLAYRENLISNEKIWLRMLADRNDSTHQYNIVVAMAYATNIMQQYLPIVKELIGVLSELIVAESGVDRAQLEFAELFRESGMLFNEYLDTVYEISGYKSIETILDKWDEVKPVCESVVRAHKS